MKTLILNARRWTDSYANTRHTCDILVDNSTLYVDRTYGGGTGYEQSSASVLIHHGIIPDSVKYLWRYCEDNDITFISNVVDVKRKKDL